MRELFEAYIDNKLRNIHGEYIDLVSGDIHRAVGGYPSNNHRMPVCCEVMYAKMQGNDRVISAPPKGKGATLKIRYYKSQGGLAMSIVDQKNDQENSLKNEFHNDMVAYHEIRKQKGYTATDVEKMLHDLGGYATARKLIQKEYTKGFVNLAEKRLLDYSIEALVLQPKFSSIFTETELKMCKERLEKYRSLY